MTTENFSTDFVALYQDRGSNGRRALFTMLNAYFGKKPVASEERKSENVSPFIDDNGKLLPLSIAAIELWLETDDAKADPVVAKVQAAAEAARKEEADLFTTHRKTVLRCIREDILRLARSISSADQKTFLNIWTAYWTGAAQYVYVPTGGVEDLTPDHSLVMDQMVVEGIAPSSAKLGLGEPLVLSQIRCSSLNGKLLAGKWQKRLRERLPSTWTVTRDRNCVTVRGWPTMGDVAARMILTAAGL